MPKRLLFGKVVSSKSDKSIVVEVIRRVKHKLYKKIIKKVEIRKLLDGQDDQRSATRQAVDRPNDVGFQSEERSANPFAVVVSRGIGRIFGMGVKM